MKLWTSLSPQNEIGRWKYLSKKLTDAGVANEFVPWEGELDPAPDLELIDKFAHVRTSSKIGAELVHLLKVQSSWITMLGVTDGMTKTPAGWWPLCAIYESFGQKLIDLGDEVDKRGSVMIAGAGGAARAAMAAFFKAGFRDFLVTNLDEEEGRDMIKEVQRRFFGLNVRFVTREEMVLLPGETSILINCTPDSADNELLTELSYLNFLKRSGFLFNLGISTVKSPLVLEAEDAGVRIVPGSHIAARADVFWAKWAFQADLDLSAYLAGWLV